MRIKEARAIMIDEKDNVATALSFLDADSEVSLTVRGRTEKVTVLSDIPAGHKFALQAMEEGEFVMKYGQPIGRATSQIARGEHVHVHNVTSRPPHKGGSR